MELTNWVQAYENLQGEDIPLKILFIKDLINSILKEYDSQIRKTYIGAPDLTEPKKRVLKKLKI